MEQTKKRSFLGRMIRGAAALAMAAVLLPTFRSVKADAANYSLWIAGTQVTDTNKSDIKGNGVFSYDSASKTLSISGNYTYTCSSTSASLVKSTIDGLTIKTTQNSTLKQSGVGWCISMTGNHTITGSGKLTVSSSAGATIGIQEGTLTIKNAVLDAINTNTSYAQGYPGLFGYTNGKIAVIDSTVNAKSQNGRAVKVNSGSFSMSSCGILAPARGSFKTDGIYQSDGTTPATNVTIGRGLWIAGMPVTDSNNSDPLGNGVFRYYPSSKTLYVYGSYSTATNLIHNQISGLTIRVSSNASLTSTGWNCIYSEEPLTVTGSGKLTLKSSATCITSCDLKIQNMTISIDAGTVGLYGDYNHGKLTVTNSTITIKSKTGAVKNFSKGITMNACFPSTPYFTKIKNGAFCDDSDTDPALNATIKAGYDLQVAGTQVTEANKADILGNGVFSFNSSTSTLNINGNCSYAGPVITTQYGWLPNVTLNVTKDSVLKQLTSNNYINTIHFNYSDVTITGGHKLTVRTDRPGGCTIDAQNLTVKDMTVDVSGANYGLDAIKKLNIINSTVYAVGDVEAVDSSTIYGSRIGIYLTDCKITSPSGASIGRNGIYESDGTTLAKRVTIVPAVKYDLWIAGTQVSDVNASDVLGNGIFSYDHANRKLTVKGSYSYNSGDLINSKLSLTVTANTASTLTASGNCIYSTGTVTILGGSALSLKGGYTCICGANVTIKNATVTADSGTAAIYSSTAGSKLSVINSKVTAKGTNAAVKGFADSITLTDCWISSPDGGKIAWVNGGNWAICNSNGTTIAKNVTISLSQNYNLWVAGTRVSDMNKTDILGNGKFSFNPSQNKLTVSGNCTASGMAIESKLSSLTLNVTADSVLTSTGWNSIYCTGDLTVTGTSGKTLTLIGQSNCGIAAKNVTIQNMKLTAEGGTTAIYSSSSGKLTVNNSTISAKGVNAAVKGFTGGIVLNSCAVTNPPDAVIKSGAIYEEDGSAFVKEVTISSKYNLWIAGTQVSVQNKSDILGNGIFSYDPASNTLTVKGDYCFSGSELIKSTLSSLTVTASKAVTLDTIDGNCIYSTGSVTVEGGSQLNLKADFTCISAPTVTIRNATVTADSGTTAIYSSSNGSKLSVINSKVTAKGTNAAVRGFTDSITLTNCWISSPDGGKIAKVSGSNWAICNSDGTTVAKNATISLSQDYSLWVAGTQVRDTNKSDILGNGKFSFNPSQNKLTVRGNCTASGMVIQSKLSSLTLYVTADSVLKSTGWNSIYSTGNLTVTGTSGKTLTLIGQSNCGIAAKNVTIQNMKVTAEGGTTAIYSSSSGKLTVTSSNITAKGVNAAVKGFSGGITLNSCTVMSPSDAVIKNGGIYENGGTTFAKEITIGSKYDLWIAGTQVTSFNASDVLGNGIFSYDHANSKLTVKGDYSCSGGDLINSKLSSLTVTASKAAALRAVSGNCIYSTGTVTILGGSALSLKGNYTGISAPTVTIKNTTVTADGGTTAIYSSKTGSKLSVINSQVTANGTNAAVRGFTDSITLTDCWISSPTGGKIAQVSGSNWAICNSNGTTVAKSVTISLSQNYDLWVAGTQVSDMNKSDILGNGKFSFNPSQNKLTVSGNCTASGMVIESKLSSLTLYVTADSVLKSTGWNSIYCSGNLTVTGTSGRKLTLIGQSNCGIAAKNVTIQNMKLTAEGGTTAIYTSSSGWLNVTNSTISAKGVNAAVKGFTGGITLTNCTVTSPSGAVIKNGGIYEKGGTAFAKEITIG